MAWAYGIFLFLWSLEHETEKPLTLRKLLHVELYTNTINYSFLCSQIITKEWIDGDELYFRQQETPATNKKK